MKINFLFCVQKNMKQKSKFSVTEFCYFLENDL